MATTTGFLVYFEPESLREPLKVDGEGFELAAGLWLVATGLTRSRLYHAVKRQLGEGAPLLVAPLRGHPKFKRLAPGALNFTRGHLPQEGDG